MQGKEASFRKHKIEQHSISVTLTQVRGHLYAIRAFWKRLSKTSPTAESPYICHQYKCRSFVVLSLCMQHQRFPRTQQGCPGRRKKNKKIYTHVHASIWIARYCQELQLSYPRQFISRVSPLSIPSKNNRWSEDPAASDNDLHCCSAALQV